MRPASSYFLAFVISRRFKQELPYLVTRTACPQPVIPGLRAGTRGVSTSAAVAPPPRVSAADHNRVADLVSEGNGQHVLSARVRAPPRVIVAARLMVFGIEVNTTGREIE